MSVRRGGCRIAALPILVAGLLAATLSPGAAMAQTPARTAVPPDAGASNVPPSVDLAERDRLLIVGSPAMAPYVDVVIEALQREYVLTTPSTKYQPAGAAFKTFCAGIGRDYPDIVASVREMRKSEFDSCIEHGVLDIIEIKIARSAVVVVTKKGDPVFNVTPRMFYLGLAAEIPVEGDFVANPYRSWNDVAKDAPNLPIHAIVEKEGGERDYFNDNFLEGGCRHLKAIDAIFAASDRVEKCITLRSDGYITEIPLAPAGTGHHDDAHERLFDEIEKAPQGTVAVFLRPHYWINRDKLELLPVAGVLPDIRNISNMTYAMTADLRFYFKRAHMRNNEGQGVVRGIREFMQFITREKAAGEGGAFERMGLIALPDEDRAAMRRTVRTLRRFTR